MERRCLNDCALFLVTNGVCACGAREVYFVWRIKGNRRARTPPQKNTLVVGAIVCLQAHRINKHRKINAFKPENPYPMSGEQYVDFEPPASS